ncbi:xanthine dehydrogenase family protein molybdopterin-binding subunit [Acuticoccus sp. I52.16.1]|uniref:xanthine dehydrogenase family protein molybdopterin-binding subunit n=1 Tax=Acuticoccus sp. I52.16.1 TaxID=2928472 RepID=UPI001FD1D7ED|nr:xanthine dehydrogenase family protein molybdopterin-binding subunit [Acuticoccus sp. I52.16.1]UOM35647.1 xanthine dehydrogenase family protein molybdopterin-binding subunit [Acuticoccus sp. I52.16.1]
MPPSSPTADGSILRLEDERFVRGRGRFTADHHRPGEAHMVVVRSPHAHAEMRRVDLAAAAAMPGVLGVYADAELAADGLGTLPCDVKLDGPRPLIVPPRRILARGRVRYVGEPVAVVVAETPAAAMDAAEAVDIDYDALEVVTDAREALAAGAPQLWDEAPGNLAFVFERGDRAATDAAFAAAAHVVELPIVNNRLSAFPMEPRAAIADTDPATGGLRLEVTGQGVHGIRSALAGSVLHIDEAELAVFAEDVGGGFGLKNFPYPEHALLLWAARRLRRPVRWVSTNADDLMGAVHARAQFAHGRLALDAEGRFLGLDVAIVGDLGAYASTVGPGSSTLAPATAMGGVYDIPAIRMQSRGAFTNTAPVDAYRGAGKPEANFIVERLIDLAARQCGFDPVALRRLNVVRTFPYRKALGAVMDCGAFEVSIDRAAEAVDAAGFAARREAARTRGRLAGLGVACFVESARGAPVEEAGLRFPEGGPIEIVTGTESNGQGHETAFAQVAAARLGLPLDAFRFVQADTRRTRMGNGHGGARSMHMGAGTLALAIEAMLETAAPVAAQLLQADPAAIEFADGHFVVRGDTGRRVALAEVARAARADGESAGLETLVRREDAPITFPSGCHFAEVEVDPQTGVVELVRYVAVDDYGHMVNPALTLGQVHGGLAQGIGQALGEDIVYDAGGQLLTGSLMDYWLPRADDLPAFEVAFNPVPTERNLLGVKGAGQAGCISAPPTVINAIVDALAPLGVRDIAMPATAERVWRAIREAQAA